MANCLNEVKAFAEKNLKKASPSEIERIHQEASARIEGIYATAEKRKVLAEYFREIRAEKAESKRALALMQTFKNNQLAADTLESLKFKSLGGEIDPREVYRGILFGEANDQVIGGDITPKGIAAGYKATLIEIPKKEVYDNPELREIIESGTADDDILLSLDDLQNKRPFRTKNEAAQKIATSIHKMQELGAKHMEGKVPAFERIDGYLQKMFWNKETITPNREAFIRDMVADYGDKTFPTLNPAQRAEAFAYVYNEIVSGTYGRAVTIKEGKANIAARMAQTRILIPNDVNAAIRARQKYGLSVHATLHKYVDTVSNDLGLIDKLGPSPVDAVDSVLQTIEAHLGATGSTKKFSMKAMKEEAQGYLGIISGTANETPVGFWAKTLHASMSWVRATTLGYARLASFTDLAMAPQAIVTMHGKNQAMTAANLISHYAQQTFKSSNSQLDAAVKLGLATDYLHGQLMDISYKNSTGFTKAGKWLGNTMNKLNLLENHVQAIRNAIANICCMHWGDRLELSFKQLDTAERNSLMRLGIKESDWELFRSVVDKRDHNGTTIRILDGDLIDKIDSEKIKAKLISEHKINVARIKEELDAKLKVEQDLLAMKVHEELVEQGASLNEINKAMKEARDLVAKQFAKKNKATTGLSVTPGLIEEAKTDLRNKFFAMVSKMADQGSSTPGVREMYLLTGGKSINTPTGALFRMFTMFKSAALVNVNNYKRAYRLGGKAITDGAGDVVGSRANISGVVVTASFATMLYMLSQYARDAAAGKEPRNPMDPEFIAKSVAASGIGGIAVSAIFDSLSESTGAYAASGAIIGTVAGPLAAKAALAVGILGESAKHGIQAAAGVPEYKRTKMPTKIALNYAQSSIPLINLFYTKAPLDYYFANGMKQQIYTKYINELVANERRKDIKDFSGKKRREYFMLNPKESVRY